LIDNVNPLLLSRVANLDAFITSRSDYDQQHSNLRRNGYVFVYFHGLGRRLFLDHLPATTGRSLAEVQRLLGSNRSFQMYASALLDPAAALTNDWPAKPPIDRGPKSPEISLGLRGAIRAMFTRGEGQTADWALAWYAASPNYGLRTPAPRSLGEFILLFRQRFHASRKSGQQGSAMRTI
jgi:TerB N-terminal domain